MDAQTHSLQLPAEAQALGGSLWIQNYEYRHNPCQTREHMVRIWFLVWLLSHTSLAWSSSGNAPLSHCAKRKKQKPSPPGFGKTDGRHGLNYHSIASFPYIFRKQYDRLHKGGSGSTGKEKKINHICYRIRSVDDRSLSSDFFYPVLLLPPRHTVK
jgi:hypothetical protein